MTRDRELLAQFEHTIGVTEAGSEVFTLSPAGLHHPERQFFYSRILLEHHRF